MYIELKMSDYQNIQEVMNPRKAKRMNLTMHDREGERWGEREKLNQM